MQPTLTTPHKGEARLQLNPDLEKGRALGCCPMGLE